MSGFKPSGGISDKYQAILEHFTLNKDEARMVLDIDFQTTEHTLYFGDSRSISTGGAELFTTNEITGEVSSFVEYSMGDHSIVAGQTVSEPRFKKFSPYKEKRLGAESNTLPSVAYTRTATPTENTASYGTTFRAAESYEGDLHYTIKVRGKTIQHRHYQVNISSGDMVTQFWKAPTVSFAGAELTIELTKDGGGDFMVYADADDNTKPWVISNSRRWDYSKVLTEDTELVTKEYVDVKTNDLDITDNTNFRHQSPSRRATRVYIQSKINNSELTDAEDEEGIAPSKKAVVEFVKNKLNNAELTDSATTTTKAPTMKAVADYVKGKVSNAALDGSSAHTTIAPSRKAVASYMKARINDLDLSDSTTTNYKAPSRRSVVEYVKGKIDNATLVTTTTSTKKAPSKKAVVDFVKEELKDMITDQTYPFEDIVLNSTSADWVTGTQVSKLLRNKVREAPVWTDTTSTTSSKKILDKIKEFSDLKVLNDPMGDNTSSTTRAPSRKVVADYVKGKVSNATLSGSSSDTNIAPSRYAVSRYVKNRIIDTNLSKNPQSTDKAPSRRATASYIHSVIDDTISDNADNGKVDIGGVRIQWGIIYIYQSGAHGGSHNFHAPYEGLPTVTVSCKGGHTNMEQVMLNSDPQSNNFTWWLGSSLDSIGSTIALSDSIHWMAIGKIPQ